MGIEMRHEARQVPSWLIFDVRQEMKSLLLSATVALAACTHLEVIHNDVVRVRDVASVRLAGLYRYPDPFWQTTIELREDHTFRYEQMTDTFQHTVVDGTWTRDGDRVKLDSSTSGGGTVLHLVVKKAGRIGLRKEASLTQLQKDGALRAVQAQTCWLEKAPNKAPEPTPGSVTPRATEGASR